ncbi:hypothetical protein Nepgr_015549 [Nepenthes gracilis]|uniref:Uncharacterized protein n=1 Tax=Nepenthes gracilis TaxID=150966 RepID=A0AAD3XQS9_NEPGR|nr:hypothetical protein Nepgr_015549 [Nepenthes gracilis]
MKLVRIGGLLIYDNTLFGGAVIALEAEVEDCKQHFTRGTIEFTKAVVANDCAELCHVPSSDGVIICKRLC